MNKYTILSMILVSCGCCFSILDSSQKWQNKSGKTTNKDVGNCDKTIRTTRLIRSPRVTSINRNRPVHCVFRLVKYGGGYLSTGNGNNDGSGDLLYELNFKTFHVGVANYSNGSRCSSGYLQIVDHPTRSNASGYYCGRLKYSRTFLAETDQLALVFHSEAYTRQTYFRVQASVLPKRLAQERHKEMVMNNPGEPVIGTYCDRIYVNCRGFCDVTSPNYPGFYPRNATCRYRIVFNDTGNDDSTLSTRSRVVLGGQYYDSFDVWGGPQSRDCQSDYCSSKEVTTQCPHDQLRIYDISDDNRQPVHIQTFCGRGHLPRIASKGNQILIEFVSAVAGSMSNDGFYLSIGPEVLREHVTDEIHEFLNPIQGFAGLLWGGFNDPEDNSVEWRSNKRDGSGTKLNDSNSSCLWLFNSNQSHQGQFHNLRHWYPPGTRCSYRFIGEVHHRVFLHFTYFNANRDADGCRSKLTLYDSDGPNGGSVRGVFCGGGRSQRHRTPNETLLSSSEQFYVEFDSKLGSYDGSSFEYSVLYTFVDIRQSDDPNNCDQTFKSIDGERHAFDFFVNRLRLRHRNLFCTLRFKGRQTERIRITFNRLQFDATKQCTSIQRQQCKTVVDVDSFDRLEIIDDRGKIIDCLCGNDLTTHEYLSTNSHLELRLHLSSIPPMAYRDTHAYSFNGRYEFLQVGCGENYLQGKQGQLVFPNLPQRLLPATVHCRWLIEVDHGRYVFIKFAHLFLGNCSSQNSLRLYAPWSKELDKELCGDVQLLQMEPLGWRITGAKTANKVVLELNASSTATFRLMWTEVSDGIDRGCEYMCPGSDYCISKELVCNGVINCPTVNVTWDPLEESLDDCVSTVGIIWHWVYATFTSSFIIVIIIAILVFWRKTRCAEIQ